MISEVNFRKESSVIGEISSPETTRANVIFLEISPKQSTRADCLSVDDLLEEFSRDEGFRKQQVVARKALAAELYSHEMESLSALRLSSGLSQTELAQKASTSQSAIAMIELGRRDPGTDLIGRIAAALRVEPARVFIAIHNQLKYHRMGS